MAAANFSGPLGNSQSFASPTNAIDPSLQVTQQQIQRQTELANALRQMSFDPIDASNGGNISWTQGMAKIAQAIAGRVVQNRADKQQIQLNKDYQTGLQGSGLYGSYTKPGGGGPASGGGGQSPPPASIAPPAPVMNVPDDPNAAPNGPPQAPPPPMPQQGQGDPLAAMPQQQMPPQGQQAPPQQQGQFVPGPLALGHNVLQNTMLAQQYPEQYGKSLVENVAKGGAPTEIEIMQQHLVEAAQRGDMGQVHALSAAIQKAIYTAPVNGRPGSTIRDPYDPSKVIGYDAPNIEGAFPTYGADGMPNGYQQAPGAAQAQAAMAGAKAGATSSAQAPYDLVKVVDAQGAEHMVPKSFLTGGGGAPPPPSPSGGGGTAPGTIGGYYANKGGGGGGAPAPAGTPGLGNTSQLGPQTTQSLTTAGTNSANVFNEAITGAQTGKDALRALGNIMTAANGLSTGSGAGQLSSTKSGFNAMADGLGLTSLGNKVLGPIGLQVGFNRDTIARFDEIKKNVSNLADQLSKGGGSTGTDSRLTNAINSLPSDHYAPAAIQEVGWNMSALAQRNVSYGNVAAQWQAQHGPGDSAAMQSTWQKAYNPDLFYHMQKGDLKQWQSSIKSPTVLAHVLDQARTLRSLGAFQ